MPPSNAKSTKSYSDGLIWTGFEYTWAHHPHRLSLLGSRLRERSFGAKSLTARHDFEVKIGAFPADSVDYIAEFQTLRSRNLFIGYGSHDGIELRAKLDNEARSTLELAVPLSQLETSYGGPAWTRCEKVCVLLSGFRIKATNFGPGWHFGGFGIELGKARHREGRVHFTLDSRAFPKRSPDPFTAPGGLGKWDRRKVCNYELCVDYVVLAGDANYLNCVHRTVSASAKGRKEWLHDKATTIQGKPGYPKALPGLRGFDFSLNSARTRKDGRYIRNLGARISQFHYNPKTGAATLEPRLSFSNDGGAAYKWDVKAKLLPTLVQVRGARGLRSRRLQDATTKGESGLIDSASLRVNWP